jgi:hypothetical protein
MMEQLKIFSRYATDGSLVSTFLQREEDALVLLEEGAPALRLSLSIVQGAFSRYGKPLEATIEEWLGAPLPLTEQVSLRAFRFMNFGDVYKTDYLCWWSSSEESLVAPAPLIAAALKALALALARAHTAK